MSQHLGREDLLRCAPFEHLLEERTDVAARGYERPDDPLWSGRVQGLIESGEFKNSEMIVFLNRLSDVLWLMARWVETKAGLA